MNISLEYLNNLNSHRKKILKDQISQTNNIQELNQIPSNISDLYYLAQKRLLELENKEYKEAEFVVIGNNQNNTKLIKLLVYDSPKQNIYTRKIKQLLNYNFDVLFEDADFAGDSYQLALYIAAYALCYKMKIKENLVFSGALKGGSFVTEKYDEKNNFCSKLNKQLIGGELSITEVVKQSFYPRKILIWASKEKKYYPEFQLIDIGLLPKKSWVSKIKNTKEKINPNDYLAFNGPSVFAFGLGAALGSNYSYTILQFNNGEYKEAITTSRYLKTIDNKTDKIEITENNVINNTECDILLHFASHAPKNPTTNQNFKQNIVIKSKVTGNISLEDYTEYVRQINVALNQIKEKYHFKTINLVLSMPVAMAFALGWAVGKFLNANLYNYFPNTASYYKVFNLTKLDSK